MREDFQGMGVQKVDDNVYKKLRRTFERLSTGEKVKIAAFSQGIIAVLSLASLVPIMRMDISSDYIVQPSTSGNGGETCPKRDTTISVFNLYLDIINGVVECLITFVLPASLYRKMCIKL